MNSVSEALRQDRTALGQVVRQLLSGATPRPSRHPLRSRRERPHAAIMRHRKGQRHRAQHDRELAIGTYTLAFYGHIPSMTPTVSRKPEQATWVWIDSNRSIQDDAAVDPNLSTKHE